MFRAPAAIALQGQIPCGFDKILTLFAEQEVYEFFCVHGVFVEIYVQVEQPGYGYFFDSAFGTFGTTQFTCSPFIPVTSSPIPTVPVFV